MRLTTEITKTYQIPNDEDGGYINIKSLSQEDLALIESQSSTAAIDSSSKISLVVDNYKRVNLVAEKCLLSWGNLFDEKGKDIKFNKLNVAKVAQCSVSVDGTKKRFLDWVESCHKDLLAEIAVERGEAEKN